MAWQTLVNFSYNELIATAKMNIIPTNFAELFKYTTKGDIIVATGSHTLGRLGVGADNSVLMASAAASTGLKYDPSLYNFLLDKQIFQAWTFPYAPYCTVPINTSVVPSGGTAFKTGVDFGDTSFRFTIDAANTSSFYMVTGSIRGFSTGYDGGPSIIIKKNGTIDVAEGSYSGYRWTDSFVIWGGYLVTSDYLEMYVGGSAPGGTPAATNVRAEFSITRLASLAGTPPYW